MLHSLQIIMPDNRGYIDPARCEGTFTVAVMDIYKKAVSMLTADNFLLYCEGEYVDDLEVAEHIVGVYSMCFPVEAKYVLGLKQGENQTRLPEVMLTVKKDGRYSNTLLIALT